jgi:hypothetical protein
MVDILSFQKIDLEGKGPLMRLILELLINIEIIIFFHYLKLEKYISLNCNCIIV